ncbi:MAG TPA: endonuclease/exonuclease/phosphatase family protein [Alphaproteobacteria bacterium]|nr:endonuclease/exonuclease/phosphatase family protein [Alphaproteobacteria bacterium]
MKIVSWNLYHRSGATLDDIERLIVHHEPDLLLMQETTDRVDDLPTRIGGHYSRDPLPGRTHGLAAWSPTAFEEAPSRLTLQPGVVVKRICQIIRLRDFAVANVHLSHGQVLNRRQLRRIAEILPERAAVLGDCNLVGPPLLPGFHDVGPRQSTHAMVNMIGLRLDRCFIRGLRCDHSEALVAAGSDHKPIMVSLSAPNDCASPRPIG